MKQKIIATLILSTIIIGFTKAECYNQYCWKNTDEMFLAAEQQFISDMQNGLHDHQATKSNQCPFHMSSIAYGFATVESGKGNSKMVEKTNNRFSVRKGSGTFQYKWDNERGYLAGSKYLKYPHEFLSTLDFMYLYKYAYSCKLGYLSIARYKTGKVSGDDATQRYYDNLMSSIKYFEKKYFGSNENIGNYALKKPDTSKMHGSATTDQNKIKRELKKIGDGTGYSFILYFQNKKDSIQTQLQKNDEYIPVIKKILGGKYTYQQKFDLIKKLITVKNENIENNKYNENILNINKVDSLSENVLKLNLSKLENIYGSYSKISLVNIPQDNASISKYPPEIFDFHNIVYNRFLKIISLNFGVYNDIDG